MGFFKKNKKILLTVLFTSLLLLQQIGVRYRLTRSSTKEMVDENGYDTMVSYEINQLETLWRKAGVEDLVNPENMASFAQLELARARLKQAEMGIRESENRVRRVTGRKRQFFQKAHAYYHHSASTLLDIVNFLLARKENYEVKGSEISFDSESDAAKFRELIQQLSSLDQEKEDLDLFIVNHNREVEKKRLAR
jgi:hypothetical protein